jgi:hypothetical protein
MHVRLMLKTRATRGPGACHTKFLLCPWFGGFEPSCEITRVKVVAINTTQRKKNPIDSLSNSYESSDALKFFCAGLETTIHFFSTFSKLSLAPLFANSIDA